MQLAGLGTGAVVIAACGGDGDSTGDGPDTTAEADSPAEGDGSVAEAGGAEASADEAGGADGGSTEAAGSAATPDCVLTPESTEGPFYADLDLVRQDITDGKPGSPLAMHLTVVDAATCEPIPDATVDIWHADAGGLYSAFPGQGDDRNIDTSAESFLRGVQSTDADGTARFNSIYPGWYPGRTTHIHMKVHFSDQTRVTTQLYFPDDVTGTVYADHPDYIERGQKDTPNADDGLGAESASLQMALATAEGGHLATHVIGIDRG